MILLLPVDVSHADSKDVFLLPSYAPFYLPKGNQISEVKNNGKSNGYLMVNKNGSPQTTDCLKMIKEKANKTGFDFVCLWWR